MTTDHDRVESHLDELGDALSAATSVPAARPDRRPLIVTGAAVATAAIAAVVVVAASPGGSPVDVLGRAEAALTARGELVHYAFAQRSGPAVGEGIDVRVSPSACESGGLTEVWQTTDPTRWRVRLPGLPHSGRCGTGPGQPAQGSREIAWAGGTQSEYVSSLRALHVTTGYAADGAASKLPIGVDPAHGNGEPIALLRDMLRRGALRDVGRRTLDGRRVRTLTASSTERARYGDGRVARLPTRLVYEVDASTFEPVRSLRTYVVPTVRREPSRGGRPGPLRIRGGRTYVEQLDFTAYDRRPLDREARALLVIHPAPGTRTTRRTHEEALRRMRRSSPRPVYR